MISPLIGNGRAVAAVRRALANASPPHAWLFVGPQGVGKTTLARWLAQAVNCERNVGPVGTVGAGHRDTLLAWEDAPANEGASESDDMTSASPPHPAVVPEAPVERCGECSQCDRIARGIHADVITVSIPAPEPNEPVHKEISVDQVREVEAAVALAPFEGRMRVVVIDPADRMSIGAQNAFLKTLEEPPARALFVLIATDEERLLPTVRSRCRRIEFGLVAADEIERALISAVQNPDLHIDGEKARLLARLAGGRPGRALAMASEPSVLDERRKGLEEASALGAMPMADLMDLSDRLTRRFREDRDEVLDRVARWLDWWRDVLLMQSGAGEGVTAVDMTDALGEDAAQYEQGQVLAFVQALMKCRERLEANVQARIALDALAVHAPRKKTPSRAG